MWLSILFFVTEARSDLDVERSIPNVMRNTVTNGGAREKPFPANNPWHHKYGKPKKIRKGVHSEIFLFYWAQSPIQDFSW